MKRARFFRFLVVGSIGLVAVSFWRNPDRMSLIADVFAAPATENEWAPPEPLIQPANSANAAPSNAPAKSDFPLPDEPKPLNLNSSELKAGKPRVEPLIVPVAQSEPPLVAPPELDSAPMVAEPAMKTVAPPAGTPEPLIVPPVVVTPVAPSAPPVDQTPAAPPIIVPEVMAPPIEKAAPPIERPLPPPEQPLPLPNVKPPVQPGVTTMISAKHVMAAVVGAAMLAAPANAEDPKNPEVVKAVEDLKAAIKRLEELEKAQSAYKAANEDTIKKIRDDVNTMTQKLNQMEMDVRTLRQAVNTPPQPLPSGSVTSKRETSGDVAPRMMGRIKLVNDYNEAMNFVVNGGTSYQLLPGESRIVSIPAGAFTYQIPQIQQAVQERSIGANEEKTIRVYPRQ